MICIQNQSNKDLHRICKSQNCLLSCLESDPLGMNSDLMSYLKLASCLCSLCTFVCRCMLRIRPSNFSTCSNAHLIDSIQISKLCNPKEDHTDWDHSQPQRRMRHKNLLLSGTNHLHKQYTLIFCSLDNQATVSGSWNKDWNRGNCFYRT